MILHLKHHLDGERYFTDPVRTKDGWRVTTKSGEPATVPLGNVAGVVGHDETPVATATMVDRIVSALDNMGGSVKSKDELWRAVGGNRTKFFEALKQAEDAGTVRISGRRVIVV